MSATQSLQSVQSQLARYYLSKLRTAEAIHQLGYEHSVDGLALWDQEWSQIKHWGDWAIHHADDSEEISSLAKDYARAADSIFRMRQHPRERLEWLEGGLEAAQQQSDTEAEMTILAYLGKSYSQLGLIEDSMAYYNSALELTRTLGNQLLECQILIALGGDLYGLDEYEKSRAIHEQAIALCKKLELHVELGRVFNGLGNLALAEGDNQSAHAYYARYLEISESHGHLVHVCMALRNLGMTARRLGDFTASRMYGERSVSLCREIGYQYCLAESLAGLGMVASVEGRLHEACDLLLQSLEVSRMISNRPNEAWVLSELGYLNLRLGDADAAIEHLEASYAAAARIDERWYMALALLQMIEVYRLTGRLDVALEKLRDGLEIAITMENDMMSTKFVLAAALIQHAQGKPLQAAEWAGMLEQFPSRFSTEQRNLYEELVSHLSAELDQEIYTAAFERGKLLVVKITAQELLNKLRLNQSSVTE